MSIALVFGSNVESDALTGATSYDAPGLENNITGVAASPATAAPPHELMFIQRGASAGSQASRSASHEQENNEGSDDMDEVAEDTDSGSDAGAMAGVDVPSTPQLQTHRPRPAVSAFGVDDGDLLVEDVADGAASAGDGGSLLADGVDTFFVAPREDAVRRQQRRLSMTASDTARSASRGATGLWNPPRTGGLSTSSNVMRGSGVVMFVEDPSTDASQSGRRRFGAASATPSNSSVPLFASLLPGGDTATAATAATHMANDAVSSSSRRDSSSMVQLEQELRRHQLDLAAQFAHRGSLSSSMPNRAVLPFAVEQSTESHPDSERITLEGGRDRIKSSSWAAMSLSTHRIQKPHLSSSKPAPMLLQIPDGVLVMVFEFAGGHMLPLRSACRALHCLFVKHVLEALRQYLQPAGTSWTMMTATSSRLRDERLRELRQRVLLGRRLVRQMNQRLAKQQAHAAVQQQYAAAAPQTNHNHVVNAESELSSHFLLSNRHLPIPFDGSSIANMLLELRHGTGAVGGEVPSAAPLLQDDGLVDTITTQDPSEAVELFAQPGLHHQHTPHVSTGAPHSVLVSSSTTASVDHAVNPLVPLSAQRNNHITSMTGEPPSSTPRWEHVPLSPLSDTRMPLASLGAAGESSRRSSFGGAMMPAAQQQTAPQSGAAADSSPQRLLRFTEKSRKHSCTPRGRDGSTSICTHSNDTSQTFAPYSHLSTPPYHPSSFLRDWLLEAALFRRTRHNIRKALFDYTVVEKQSHAMPLILPNGTLCFSRWHLVAIFVKTTEKDVVTGDPIPNSSKWIKTGYLGSHTDTVTCMKYDAALNCLFTSSFDGTIKRWGLRDELSRQKEEYQREGLFSCQASYKVTINGTPAPNFHIFSFDVVHLKDYKLTAEDKIPFRNGSRVSSSRHRTSRHDHQHLGSMNSFLRRDDDDDDQDVASSASFHTLLADDRLKSAAKATHSSVAQQAFSPAATTTPGSNASSGPSSMHPKGSRIDVLNAASSLLCCGSEWGGVALLHVDGTHSSTLGIATTSDTRVRQIRFLNQLVFDDAASNLAEQASAGGGQQQGSPLTNSSGSVAGAAGASAGAAGSVNSTGGIAGTAAATGSTPSLTPLQPTTTPLIQQGTVVIAASTFGGMFILSHTIFRKVCEVTRDEPGSGGGMVVHTKKGYHYFATALQMTRLHFFHHNELPISIDVPRPWWHRNPLTESKSTFQDVADAVAAASRTGTRAAATAAAFEQRVSDDATDAHPYFVRPLLLLVFRRMPCILATLNPVYQSTPPAVLSLMQQHHPDSAPRPILERQLPGYIGQATCGKISPSHAFVVVALDSGKIVIVSPRLVPLRKSRRGPLQPEEHQQQVHVDQADAEAADDQGANGDADMMPPDLSADQLHSPALGENGEGPAADAPPVGSSQHDMMVAATPPAASADTLQYPTEGQDRRAFSGATSAVAPEGCATEEDEAHLSQVREFFGPLVFKDRTLLRWQSSKPHSQWDHFQFSQPSHDDPTNICHVLTLFAPSVEHACQPVVNMDVDGWKLSTIDVNSTVMVFDLESLTHVITLTLLPAPHHGILGQSWIERAVVAESRSRPTNPKYVLWSNSTMLVSPLPITSHTLIADFSGEFVEDRSGTKEMAAALRKRLQRPQLVQPMPEFLDHPHQQQHSAPPSGVVGARPTMAPSSASRRSRPVMRGPATASLAAEELHSPHALVADEGLFGGNVSQVGDSAPQGLTEVSGEKNTAVNVIPQYTEAKRRGARKRAHHQRRALYDAETYKHAKTADSQQWLDRNVRFLLRTASEDLDGLMSRSGPSSAVPTTNWTLIPTTAPPVESIRSASSTAESYPMQELQLGDRNGDTEDSTNDVGSDGNASDDDGDLVLQAHLQQQERRIVARIVQMQTYPFMFHMLYIFAPPVVMVLISAFVGLFALCLDGLISCPYTVPFLFHFVLLPHYFGINAYSYKPLLAHHSGVSFLLRICADALYLIVFPVVYLLRRDGGLFADVSWVILALPLCAAILLAFSAARLEDAFELRHAIALDPPAARQRYRVVAVIQACQTLSIITFIVCFAIYFDDPKMLLEQPPVDAESSSSVLPPSGRTWRSLATRNLSIFVVFIPIWAFLVAYAGQLPGLVNTTVTDPTRRVWNAVVFFVNHLVVFLGYGFVTFLPLVLFCLHYDDYFHCASYPHGRLVNRTVELLSNASDAAAVNASHNATSTSSTTTVVVAEQVPCGSFTRPLLIAVTPVIIGLLCIAGFATTNVLTHVRQLRRG